MIQSMTGFARRERPVASDTLAWELRSINHRFLDLSFRLPEEFRRFEPRFRRTVMAALRRGKVDCSLQLQRAPRGPAGLQINEALAARIIESARVVGGLMTAPGAVNPIDILRWPGVVEEPRTNFDPLQAAATELLEGALEELGAARREEGTRIHAMLESRLSALDGLLREVRARLPEAHARIREKTLDRVRQLGIDTANDRLEQELVLLAQRLDVAEELDRFESHLTAMRYTLAGAEPAGRRLDFLLQELNREANTLASKSQDVDTTRAAVDMKVLIEQLREQVQNVE
ncbi:MAG: YicC/YloC family endoribonuclease [Gammaproteobacteria bacterium]